MVKSIRSIKNEEIKGALENSTRQYLIGKLQKPQVLEYIEDEKLEIGITNYEKFFSEMPHTHSVAYEYQYMISGYTEYIDLDTDDTYKFKKGDFYVISPGVRYAQKSKPGTTIFFIKTPPGNDKVNIELDTKIESWLNDKIKTVRKDYTDYQEAPPANSLKPAAAVAIINEKQEILLLKRKDSGKWTMPGGTLEFGESLITCAKREVEEETGYQVLISDIIGTYTNPKTVIEYSDGEVRQEFTIVYKGEIVEGEISLDDESADYKWIKLEETLNLPLADSQRKRLRDVVEYNMTGKKALK